MNSDPPRARDTFRVFVADDQRERGRGQWHLLASNQPNEIGIDEDGFIDTDMKFTRAGRVVSWDYYVGRAGTQRMQIWRSTGNTDEFTLICENEVSTDSAGSVVHKEINDKEACFFEAGDMVGWYGPLL